MRYRTVTQPPRIVSDAELAEEERKRHADPVRYVLGLDLGKQQDYTALCVGTYIEGDSEALDVVHLERLPLGTSYIAQVDRVVDLFKREPLAGRCDLIVDATGVGRPVVDMMKDRNLRPLAVTITGGKRATETGHNEWSVPKIELVSTIQIALQNRSLRIADGLPFAGVLRDELAAFQMRVTDRANLTFDAISGHHDNLVVAVALCCWWIGVCPEAAALW